MQFYRRWLYRNDLDVRRNDNLITDLFSTWGFVELDGSPLKKTYSGHWANSDTLNMRWRYNTSLDTFFTYGSSYNTSPQGNNQLLWYVPNDKNIASNTDQSSRILLLY